VHSGFGPHIQALDARRRSDAEGFDTVNENRLCPLTRQYGGYGQSSTSADGISCLDSKGSMVKKELQKRPEIIEGANDTTKVHPLSRRAFVIRAASACGAIVAWRSLPLAAANAGEGNVPGMVTIVQFSPDGKKIGKASVPRIIKSDLEWKKQLSPISYEVARQAGTEQPYTGSTWDLHDRGLFRCICCDNALFNSDTKFDSGTGWPSFWEPIAHENVVETNDASLGMMRTEVSCRQCNAHLGHVFDDGPRPTGLRYCMNSAAMRFVKLA
jgi:peptide-methionine (R)-S-oxide reductase